ncbi:sugar transferase [Psychrobacter sp. P2G3]|uniref:sugar transferase n=1 Tax=Psychrobacter sp. P2G3 TaxID=1699622 RepID=UPI00078D6C12|nr:sugar transferase [Psychrobacter sp. P2G3]AMN49100.1 sugar transferase [Psychrobacter sp. P2G3]
MIKRLFDITAATTALIILSPVYGLVAYKVKKNLGSPVLFRQVRPGLNSEPFEMFKFRTMTDAVDSEGKPLSDGERITDFGRFLRKTSLDELPELLNIIKGDMSIVGPRPLLMKYLPYYTEEESKRHSVRPGLTGLAQVNGRNMLNWDDRLSLDSYYVDNMSLLLDAKIILKTVLVVFNRKDIAEVPSDIFPSLDIYRKSYDS